MALDQTGKKQYYALISPAFLIKGAAPILFTYAREHFSKTVS